MIFEKRTKANRWRKTVLQQMNILKQLDIHMRKNKARQQTLQTSQKLTQGRWGNPSTKMPVHALPEDSLGAVLNELGFRDDVTTNAIQERSSGSGLLWKLKLLLEPRESQCPRGKPVSGEEFSLTSWEGSAFLLFRSSIDWVRPTPTLGRAICLSYPFKCDPIQSVLTDTPRILFDQHLGPINQSGWPSEGTGNGKQGAYGDTLYLLLSSAWT